MNPCKRTCPDKSNVRDAKCFNYNFLYSVNTRRESQIHCPFCQPQANEVCPKVDTDNFVVSFAQKRNIKYLFFFSSNIWFRVFVVNIPYLNLQKKILILGIIFRLAFSYKILSTIEISNNSCLNPHSSCFFFY